MIVDILKKNPVTIRWDTNKVTDNLKLPFSGVPYILLAKRRYQCHQGEDMHKKLSTEKETVTNFRPLFH